VEEGGAVRVLYYTAYNPYFRTNAKLFSATDFIAELLQHLPGAPDPPLWGESRSTRRRLRFATVPPTSSTPKPRCPPQSPAPRGLG
jgi:hypothetical protein